MDFKISLAGDLGSGKTTVAKILEKKYGATIVSAGHIHRELAQSMNLTIEKFNIFMENDRSYDKKLDDLMASYDTKEGNYIFDSRMAWHFVPSAVSFYIAVDKEEAARRVFNANRADENFKSVEDTLESLTSRRASERKRYKEYYGQDIMDMSNYDFVIDTTHLTVDEVVDKIVSCFESVAAKSNG